MRCRRQADLRPHPRLFFLSARLIARALRFLDHLIFQDAVIGLRDDDLFLGYEIDFAADEGCTIVAQPLGGRRS